MVIYRPKTATPLGYYYYYYYYAAAAATTTTTTTTTTYFNHPTTTTTTTTTTYFNPTYLIAYLRSGGICPGADMTGCRRNQWSGAIVVTNLELMGSLLDHPSMTWKSNEECEGVVGRGWLEVPLSTIMGEVG